MLHIADFPLHAGIHVSHGTEQLGTLHQAANSTGSGWPPSRLEQAGEKGQGANLHWTTLQILRMQSKSSTCRSTICTLPLAQGQRWRHSILQCQQEQKLQPAETQALHAKEHSRNATLQPWFIEEYSCYKSCYNLKSSHTHFRALLTHISTWGCFTPAPALLPGAASYTLTHRMGWYGNWCYKQRKEKTNHHPTNSRYLLHSFHIKYLVQGQFVKTVEI